MTEFDIEVLKKEIERLNKEADSKSWGLQKTNDSIKILYKDLEKKNKELKKLDQLKADFVSTVSHELRTPLTIIRQGVSLLQRKILGEINDQQKETLTDVIDNVDRLVNIINDILDMSKLEAGKMELAKTEVDTIGFIKKFIDQFQIKAESKEIDLLVDLPQTLPALYGDKDKLIQVLTNIIGNAIKFTPEKGKVIVSASEDGDLVKISVSDSGIGISKEDSLKLFDRFQQFGRKDGPGEQGTGLGLAISKEMVELHGGTIWVESEINKGSKFIFTIPKYEVPEVMCAKKINKYLEKIGKEKAEQKFSLIILKNYSNYADSGSVSNMPVISSIIHKHMTHIEGEYMVYENGDCAVLLPQFDIEEAINLSRKIVASYETAIHKHTGKEPDKNILLGMAVFPENGKNGGELLGFAENESTRKKKILIVDDQDQIILFIKRMVEKNDMYECMSASDGQEAIAKVHELRPDLVICDLIMPKMNGYELIGYLKSNLTTKHIPIIILSGQNIEDDKIISMIPDGLPVLSKNDGFDRISNVIRQTL